MRTSAVWLAGAVDLGQTALGLHGLSLGVRGALPVTDTDLRVSCGRFNLIKATDHREIDTTLGVHWRSGSDDWLTLGAFVNPQRSHVVTEGSDPVTLQPFRQSGTTNLWFARVGVRIIPFVPLAPLDVSGRSSLGDFLSEIRFLADFEHRNMAVHGSPSRREQAGYFGTDARLLPDAWNPLADYLRVDVISGIDTDTGWGFGLGLYGNGPSGFLGCNPGYSSRLTRELAARFGITGYHRLETVHACQPVTTTEQELIVRCRGRDFKTSVGCKRAAPDDDTGHVHVEHRDLRRVADRIETEFALKVQLPALRRRIEALPTGGPSAVLDLEEPL